MKERQNDWQLRRLGAADPARCPPVESRACPPRRRPVPAQRRDGGDTYTILLKGEDAAGLYCLIDLHIPPGGGPPPHRHDFEEMFAVLEGEIEFTFRG